MAKESYIGVNGVARKVKQPYIGVSGVARKVLKAYIGVGGVARLTFNNAVPISTVPSYSKNLTYNGSPQSTTWRNYDTSQLQIGGTTSATDAGTYYATFTPKDGYCWWDGTTTPKQAYWRIDRQSVLAQVSYLNGVDFYRFGFSNANGPAYQDGSGYWAIEQNIKNGQLSPNTWTMTISTKVAPTASDIVSIGFYPEYGGEEYIYVKSFNVTSTDSSKHTLTLTVAPTDEFVEFFEDYPYNMEWGDQYNVDITTKNYIHHVWAYDNGDPNTGNYRDHGIGLKIDFKKIY